MLSPVLPDRPLFCLLIVVVRRGLERCVDQLVRFPKIRVKRGCLRFKGILDRRERRILLILNFQKPFGALAGNVVHAYDCSDVIPVQPHARIQKLPVCDILVRCLDAPGMTGSWKLDVRHVKAGDNLHDTGHLLCLRCIDGKHLAIRDG